MATEQYSIKQATAHAAVEVARVVVQAMTAVGKTTMIE